MKKAACIPCLLTLAGVLAGVLVGTLVGAVPAAAGDLAFGPRLGYTGSGSLDQFHVGAHVEAAHLGTNLTVLPSLEIGSGDGTLIALNGDLLYDATELATGKWGFYGGGGPVLTRYDGEGADHTDFALSLVAGLTWDIRNDRHLFGELRLGLEDAPDIKLTAGLTFR